MAHRAGWSAEPLFKQLGGIGPCDRMHPVKGHGPGAPQQLANQVEIKQLFHQLQIVMHPIEHLHG